MEISTRLVWKSKAIIQFTIKGTKLLFFSNTIQTSFFSVSDFFAAEFWKEWKNEEWKKIDRPTIVKRLM